MQKILEYQKYDVQLRQIRRQLNSNADFQVYNQATKWLKEGLENRARYEKEVGEINLKLRRINALLAEKNKEIDENVDEIDKCEDIKEVDNLARIINELYKAVAALDRENRALLASLGEISSKYDSYRSKLGQVKQRALEAKSKFEVLAKEKEPEIIELKNKMAAAEKEIPEQLLQQYKLLKTQNIFPVFVELSDGNRCGGCGMEISMAHRQEFSTKNQIRCESCRRVIFKP